MIALGTDDGIFVAGPTEADRIALAGRRVTHLARGGGALLAALPGDGLFAVEHGDVHQVFLGDARSCAVGPDGAWYVGVEPAMVHRSSDRGATWTRCDAIDALPTRTEWTFPPPPHQPHVLSIDFLPGEPGSVLAGIEVGGVILSRDAGQSWQELNRGVYVDVHSVRPDPGAPGRLVAVTGRGFYASEDAGATWERRMDSVGHGYTIGLAVNEKRPGEMLVTAGDRPPGLNGRVYHTLDAGLHWREVEDAALRTDSKRAAVPFFHDDRAWLATDTGQLLCANDSCGAWESAGALPARINAVAPDGSPSSVMH